LLIWFKKKIDIFKKKTNPFNMIMYLAIRIIIFNKVN
jgi:hypothetical protein